MAQQIFSALQNEFHAHLTNRIIRITTYSSVILCVLTLCVPLFYWSSLPPSIPLWFSRPWGPERLAAIYWIFLPPVSCLFWLTTTVAISTRLLKEYLVFAQILSIVTLVISIMSCITVMTILSLVM